MTDVECLHISSFFPNIFVYGFQSVFGVLKTILGLVRWLLPHGLSWMSTDRLSPISSTDVREVLRDGTQLVEAVTAK